MKLNEITIEVTQRCSNHCIYCSSLSDNQKEESLPIDTIYRVVDDAVILGVREISISGGEPFLRNDLDMILEFMAGKGIKVYIYTSGICFDGEYGSIPKERLKVISGIIDKLIINYETVSPELFSVIMNAPAENLSYVEETIQNAIEIGIPVEAHLVPMSCNYKGIPDVINKLFSMGVSCVSFLRLVSQGRVLDNKHLVSLSAFEQAEVIEMLTMLKEQYGDRIRLGKPFQVERPIICLTGTSKLTIRYDGFVFPCEAFKDGFMSFKSFKSENVKEKSLIDIYANSTYICAVREELKSYYNGAVSDPCFGQFCRMNKRFKYGT